MTSNGTLQDGCDERHDVRLQALAMSLAGQSHHFERTPLRRSSTQVRTSRKVRKSAQERTLNRSDLCRHAGACGETESYQRCNATCCSAIGSPADLVAKSAVTTTSDVGDRKLISRHERNIGEPGVEVVIEIPDALLAAFSQCTGICS